jgi:predicted 3-demethylubiquinone-9 3-methyltransferase (glyoxalase superfamily)
LTTDGGREVMCGWLRDRFGVSWQIIPAGLNDLLADPDPVRAKKAMVAMLGMKKIVLAEIEAAMDADG